MSASTNPNGSPAARAHASKDEACDAGRLDDLRDAGNRLLEETKGLRAELAKQAQKHPVAAFGLAFTAGLLVARALRR